MPVRVYDIAKKLGLENKEILTKAKAMGIAAAKVPSSSLDKITAEDLENHLLEDHPEIVAKFAAPPVVEIPKPTPPVEEKVVFIHPPPPAPEPPVEIKPEPVVEAKIEPASAPAPVVVAPPPVAVPPPPPPKPVVPVVPPAPPKPQVGDLVGRIQLPVRPSSRPPERERDRDRGGSQ